MSWCFYCKSCQHSINFLIYAKDNNSKSKKCVSTHAKYALRIPIINCFIFLALKSDGNRNLKRVFNLRQLYMLYIHSR